MGSSHLPLPHSLVLGLGGGPTPHPPYPDPPPKRLPLAHALAM